MIWAGKLPAQSTAASIGQLWRDASAAQKAGQYSQAAALYKKILRLKPDLIEAEVNLGLMEQLTGDFPAAIKSFDRALAKDKTLSAPNLLAGLDYLKLDSPDLALPYLLRAVESNPQSAEARTGLANAELKLHRLPEAEDEFKRAVKLNEGKNADPWYGLGATYLGIEREAEGSLSHSPSQFRNVLLAETYLEQGQHEKAIATFKNIVDSRESVPCILTLLGFAYLRNANVSDAAHRFEMDWNSGTGSGCLLAELGSAAVFAEQSNTDAAIHTLQDVNQVDSSVVKSNVELFWGSFAKAGIESHIQRMLEQSGEGDPKGAQLALADRYWNTGEYSKCSSGLAASLSSLSSGQLRLLSRCSYYIGRDDLVLNSTKRLLKSIPADAEALYWRAQAAQRLGLEALTTAKKIDPASASLYVLSGDMLRGKGDLSQAADDYRKAIALKPDFLAAHLGLARVLDSDNDFEAAKKELEYVLRINPNDPEANYLLGELLLNHGDSDAAFGLLQKALQAAGDELLYVHADLSRIYEERGDTEHAISELKEALKADNDGSYHFRLGRLYLKAGDKTAAARAMQESEAMHQYAPPQPQ